MAPASAADAPLPSSMVAVGDSITQAASSAGVLGADAPQNSWSTGTSATVNSHYLRLLALGAPISGQNHNRSVSGAKMANLSAQMASAATLQPDYLTVLMGGNDLCTDTVGEMTSVADFGTQFADAMATITTASPGTRVYVVSVPNVHQLWELFKGDFWARLIWASAGICQSLLASPGSTDPADVQRREEVRARNADYNTQLALVCAAYQHCLFDGNAVFNTPFTQSDVSGDYFHPSVSGQAKLAEVTWAWGYTWVPPNQAPVAGFSSTCTGLTCDFSDASTDADGTIESWSWTFGDGGMSTGATSSHTYAAAGTYAIGLTVIDDDGATATASGTVTVAPAPATTMWVESLTYSTTSARRTWTATVEVFVVDTDGRGVPNAAVSAAWSVGRADTCTTGTSGGCTVTSDGLNARKVASVKLTVTALTHATLEWDDTQGLTTITVQRPA